MLLINFLLAFMALVIPTFADASAQITTCDPAATVTSFFPVSVLTVTVTGPTVTITDPPITLAGVTITVDGGCSSTSPVASSSSVPTTSAFTSGVICPQDGYVKLVTGNSTLWPCGIPPPTESLTTAPIPSTITVQPTDDSISETTWVTSTSYATKSSTPLLSTSTSTVFVTESEGTTTLSATSFTTILSGTRTIVEPSDSPATLTSSPLTSSSSMSFSLTSSPLTSSPLIPSSPSSTALLSSFAPSGWNTSSSRISSSSRLSNSSFTGLGPSGWNTSLTRTSWTGLTAVTPYTPVTTSGVTSTPWGTANSTVPAFTTYTLTWADSMGGSTTVTVLPTRNSSSSWSFTSQPYPTSLNTSAMYSTSTPPASTGIPGNSTLISASLASSTTRPAFTTASSTSALISTRSAMSSFSLSSNATFTALSTSSTSNHPVPSDCTGQGEYGAFTMTWDDTFDHPTNGSVPFLPVYRPYHHLMFASGFVYVPPPADQIEPVSSPFMAMYMPNMTDGNNLTAPRDGHLPRGGIGAGHRACNSAFWFDVTGGNFACGQEMEHVQIDPVTVKCKLEVSGFRWNESTSEEVLHSTNTFDMPSCRNATGDECKLAWVDFTSEREQDFESLRHGQCPDGLD